MKAVTFPKLLNKKIQSSISLIFFSLQESERSRINYQYHMEDCKICLKKNTIYSVIIRCLLHSFSHEFKKIIFFFTFSRTPIARGFYKLYYLNFQIQADLNRLRKELPKSIKCMDSDDRLFMIGSLVVSQTGRWSSSEVGVRGPFVLLE